MSTKGAPRDTATVGSNLGTSNKRKSKKSAPRLIENNGGNSKSRANAFTRLQLYNIITGNDDVLFDLPGPGSYGISNDMNATDETVSKSPGYFRAKSGCRTNCLLAVLLLLFEIICLIMGLTLFTSCITAAYFITFITILAVIIITIEWLRSWIFQESSPMLLPKLYQSTVKEVNANLEVLAGTLQPPIKNETASIFVITSNNGQLSETEPRVSVLDPLKKPARNDYSNGGGYRGPLAQVHNYDTVLTCLVIILFILYTIAFVSLIYGAVEIPNIISKNGNTTNENLLNENSTCNTIGGPVSIAVVGTNFAFWIVRALVFLGSNLCYGLCFLCRNRNKRFEETPIVVNASSSVFIPDLSMKTVSILRAKPQTPDMIEAKIETI